MRGKDRLMTLVDPIADGLADQVIADRPNSESMTSQDFMPGVAVGVVAQCFLDVKMIAPASELEPVKSP